MVDNDPFYTEDIGNDNVVGPTKGFENETNIKPSNPQAFQSYMQQPLESKAMLPPDAMTPMQLMGNDKNLAYSANMGSVNNQSDELLNNIQNVKNKLNNTPNLKFESFQRKLLNTKLASSNENIRAAAKQLKLKMGKPPASFNSLTPVTRFLSYLSDGERQINKVKAKLSQISSSNKHLKPADLMLIQVKMSQAQQELEYSSVLLGKVTEDIKQMINIQL